MVVICEILSQVGVDRSQLNAVAISEGPGSYTGLRIGAATAKGLCYALDVPLLAVNTLGAMACQMRQNANVQTESLLCPMLDARRMEVYTALYKYNMEMVMETSAIVVDGLFMAQELSSHPIYFFGDGMNKCKPLLAINKNAQFIDHVRPSADSIGEMAWQHWKEGKLQHPAYFEPLYLKEFMAKKPSGKNLIV